VSGFTDRLRDLEARRRRPVGGHREANEAAFLLARAPQILAVMEAAEETDEAVASLLDHPDGVGLPKLHRALLALDEVPPRGHVPAPAE
jgi:hypothetical protein